MAPSRKRDESVETTSRTGTWRSITSGVRVQFVRDKNGLTLVVTINGHFAVAASALILTVLILGYFGKSG